MLLIASVPAMHTIVGAAMPKLAALNSQHSAHMFWSFGSSAVIARSFLEAPAEHAIKNVFDPNCQELANSVRACAKLAFVNEQLLRATMQAGGLRIPHSVPQDFANVSRELCKTSHIDVPTMSATASLSLQRVHESNAQDLANAVQRLANVQFRSVLLMHSAAHHAGTQMGQFEGSDFSSTAWSFSTMESTCEALFEAIADEVSKKLASLGPQQLGTLADLNLPCQGAVEEELRVIIQQFAEDVPSSIDGFRSGRYQSLVEDLAVDSFGSWGDQLLLDLLGIPECTLDFRQKATKLAEEYQEQQQSWWRSESLLRAQVVSVAEIDIRAGDVQVTSLRFQKNGFDGWRPSKEWLRPTALPFNVLVDRSLCSENQLLSKLYEKLHDAALSKTSCRPSGRVQLYVTGAPCLSCVGAMRQFSMLLPLVQLNISIGPEIRPDLSQLLELQTREKDVASYYLAYDYACVWLVLQDKQDPTI
ncbi:unnamed protein product [Symbiodinium sp. CCMP2456]|nr:unnamed protein product [Symbiodinium sp. CCMP2456]